MERAADRCVDWLDQHKYLSRSFSVFCGKGNNGGDGLAIARLLVARQCRVVVYILEFGHLGTEDFQVNLARLHEAAVEVRFIQDEDHFRNIPEEDIIIDALFGCGLNRPLEGITATLIKTLNVSGNEIITVDIPSGLYVDRSSKGNVIVQARHTLSFQCYKLAFMMAENEPYIGEVHILDIGLHPGYPGLAQNELSIVDIELIRAICKPRRKFAHKGNFGHALLIAGSEGKMGAVVLAAKACLRSGAGLLTCHIPRCGNDIMQTAIPEAMVVIDHHDTMNTLLNEDLSVFSVIGAGPGIGTDAKTKKLVEFLLQKYKSRLVLDADALNILASQKEWLSLLPPYTILTPHPKEFERLFGPAANDFERLQSAVKNSRQYNIIIILKGHYTFIALPDGKGYFNSTGNAGMAKGGSGDTLTGIISGISAQGYSPFESAIFSVYLHGLAGDFAAGTFSEPAMLASDLTESLGKAFLFIEAGKS